MTIAASFTMGSPSFAAVLTKRIPAARPIARAISARIMATKRRLKAGGLLRQVEWLRKSGPRDQRGRQAVTSTLIEAFIEQRPAIDRGRLSTDRADDTVLTILDPLAIIDSDTFRWGDNTYSVSKIDGVIKNEDTGTRFSSEVTLIR